MSEFFVNKFSFDAVKWNFQVALCMVIIWLTVMATTISSIVSQPYTVRQRAFWIFLVVCFPVVGVMIYLPFSLAENKYPLLFSLTKKK